MYYIIYYKSKALTKPLTQFEAIDKYNKLSNLFFNLDLRQVEESEEKSTDNSLSLKNSLRYPQSL